LHPLCFIEHEFFFKVPPQAGQVLLKTVEVVHLAFKEFIVHIFGEILFGGRKMVLKQKHAQIMTTHHLVQRVQPFAFEQLAFGSVTAHANLDNHPVDPIF
jgi:hypothetical protein